MSSPQSNYFKKETIRMVNQLYQCYGMPPPTLWHVDSPLAGAIVSGLLRENTLAVGSSPETIPNDSTYMSRSIAEAVERGVKRFQQAPAVRELRGRCDRDEDHINTPISMLLNEAILRFTLDAALSIERDSTRDAEATGNDTSPAPEMFIDRLIANLEKQDPQKEVPWHLKPSFIDYNFIGNVLGTLDPVADWQFAALAQDQLYPLKVATQPPCRMPRQLEMKLVYALSRQCSYMDFQNGDCVLAAPPVACNCYPDTTNLHNTEGPALAFPDNWEIYAICGLLVPQKAVTAPETISERDIGMERNFRARRLLVQLARMNTELAEKERWKIAEDQFGQLWLEEIDKDDPDWEQIGFKLMVRVVNTTPDHNGKHTVHWLRTPPDMRDAREAVAWTFHQQSGSNFTFEMES